MANPWRKCNEEITQGVRKAKATVASPVLATLVSELRAGGDRDVDGVDEDTVVLTAVVAT